MCRTLPLVTFLILVTRGRVFSASMLLGHEVQARDSLDLWYSALVLSDPSQTIAVDPGLSARVSGWKFRLLWESQVVFSIWRGSGQEYTLVGLTDISRHVAGDHTLELPTNKHIILRPGDVLGLEWKATNPVPYDQMSCPSTQDARLRHVIPAPSEMSVGDNLTFTLSDAISDPCRHYSFQAIIETGLDISAYNFLLQSAYYFPNPPGIVTMNLTLPEDTDITSDRIMCNFRFDDQVVSSQPMTSHVLSLSYQYPPEELGYKKVFVICGSALTSRLVTSFLDLKSPLQGLAVTVSRNVLLVSAFLTVDVTCTSGEVVKLIIDFGDGNKLRKRFPNDQCNRSPAIVEHSYGQPGEYLIQVHGWNIVSPNQTVETTVRVLNPVTSMELNAPQHVAYPPGLLNMTVTYRGHPNRAPKDVSLDWTVIDPRGKQVAIDTLQFHQLKGSGRATEYAYVQITLPYYELGVYTTRVNCSNPVSHQIVVQTVTMEAVIEDMTIEIESAAIASGENIKGHVTLVGGTALSLSILYGDKTHEILSVPDHLWNESVNIPFTHKYRAVGNYTITATVKNPVFSRDVKGWVAVLNPITGFSLGSNLNTYYHEADIPVGILIEFSAGSDISLWIDFDDGLNEVEMTISDAKGYSELYQKTFHVQRDYNISCKACNMLGCMNVTITLDVLFPVSNLTLTSNSPVVFPPGQISLLVEHMGNPAYHPGLVSLDWTFTNEHGEDTSKERPDTFPPTDISSDISERGKHLELIQLDGTVLGRYNVKLVCSNPVSSQELSVEVLAQAAIGVIELRVDQEVVITDQHVDIILTITTGSHEEVILDTGDGTIYKPNVPEHIWDSPVEIHIKHTYQHFKQYQIRAVVRNNVSESEGSIKIDVHEEVREITILTSPTTAQVGENVTVTVYMVKGSHITIKASFGDVSPPETKFVPDTTMLPVSFIHQFTSEGTYAVSVQICNVVRCQSATYEDDIIVQYVPRNISYEIQHPPYIAEENKLAEVIISLFVAAGTPKPSNVNITCLSPGGLLKTVHHNFLSDVDLRYEVTFPGYHTLQCNFTNYVASTVVDFLVFVFEAISLTSFTAYSTEKTVIGKNNTLIMPLGVPVEFHIDFESGSNITLHLDFGDNKIEWTNVSESKSVSLKHLYDKPGNYLARLWAFNIVSNVSASVHFILQREVSLAAVQQPCPCSGHTNITFTLLEDQIPSNTCYVWDMGDNTIRTAIGGQNCLSLNRSEGPFAVMPLYDAARVKHKHSYIDTGMYNVTVWSFNEISSQLIEQTVEVTSMCSQPQITFQDEVGTFNSPVKHQRSECFKVEALVTVHCPPMESLVYNWSLREERVNSSYLKTIQKELNSPRLQFSPEELNFGIYRTEVTVYPSPYHNAMASSVYYFQITPSLLDVAILGGPIVSVPADIPLTLNGLDMTFDPDEPLATRGHKGMVFSWYCRLPQESFSETLIQGFSAGPKSDVDQSGTGGCFGDGPGRLSETIGILVVPAGILKLGNRYIFRLVVRKDTRTSLYDQEVRVVDDPPLDIHIRCITNCGPKVNPSSQLSLEASCLNCADQAELEWTWTLRASNGSSPIQEVPLEPLTITGTGQRSVSLRADSLRTNTTYQLTVQGDKLGRLSGRSIYDIKVNIPPYGGYCQVIPSSGFAFETQFVVSCYHWTDEGVRIRMEDPGCDGPVSYRVGYKRRAADTVQYLYIGVDSTSRGMLLPAGQPQQNGSVQVVVQVVDAGGEATTTTYPVQVLLNLTMEELTAEVNQKTNEMSSLMASGDIQQGVELAHSLLALVDHKVPQDSLSTSNSSDNTSAYDAARHKRAEVVGQVVDAVAGSYRPLATFSEVMQVFSVMDAAVQSKDVMNDATQMQASGAMEEMAKNLAELNQTSNLDMFNALNGILSGQVNLLAAPPSDRENPDIQNGEKDVSEKGASIKRSLDRSLGAVGPAITRKMVPGEPPYLQEAGEFSLLLTKGSPGDQPLQVNMSEVQLQLPSLTSDEDNTPSVQGLSYKEDPYWWSGSKMPPKSKVISLNMLDGKSQTSTDRDSGLDGQRSKRDTQEKGGREAMQLQMSVSKPEVEPNITYPTPLPPYWLSYHKFYVNNSAGLLHITLTPAENISDISYRVYIKNDSHPTPFDFRFIATLPHPQNSSLPVELHNTMVVPLKDMIPNIPYYLAIEQIGGNLTDNETLAQPTDSPYLDGFDQFTEVSHSLNSIQNSTFSSLNQETWNGTGWNSSLTDSIPMTTLQPMEINSSKINVSWFLPYIIEFSELVCLRWSDELKDWTTGAAICQISEESTPKSVKFKSNLFGSFGVGLFTPPNLIDFSTVFDDIGQKLLENIHVVATISAIFILYIIILPVLRRIDNRDTEKWKYHRLAFEPQPSSEGTGWEYRLSVYTGSCANAGTMSNVFFILTGEKGDTGVRVLADSHRKGFKRGGVANLVLWNDTDLGELKFLHLWHDNSGQGDQASWYLSRVRVRDMHHDKRYVFVCERWLGQEEHCDCVLIPATLKQLEDLGHTPGGVTVYDEHLWLSVAIRPSASSFTRIQRWSCCICLLFLSMVANAMWYSTEVNTVTQSAITLGPINFTVHDVYVSFMSCITVFPVSILIVYLFQHTRPKANRKRKRRPSDLPVRAVRYLARSPSTLNKETTLDADQKSSTISVTSSTRKKQGCARNRLPHCCLYLAWLLVGVSIVTSAFFTILYSLEWGGDKSRAWLIAFCLSTIENIFIITPAKVIVVILFYTLFLAKPTNDDDDDTDIATRDDDKDDVSETLCSASTIFNHGGYVKPPNSIYDPEKTAEILERARQKYTDAVKNAGLLRSVIGHACYLTVLLFIAYTSQDPITQHQNQQTRDLFLTGLDTDIGHPIEQFWGWVQEGFIESLYATEWYNGDPLTGLDLLETVNRGAIRQGEPRLRQLRAAGGCGPPTQISPLIQRCYGRYGEPQPVQKNDTTGWAVGGPLTKHKPTLSPGAYLYHPSKTKGVDFWGYYHSYSLGGFVVTLPGEKQTAVKFVQELSLSDWLDGHTRAVFAEAILFSMNVNLFTRVRFLFEFPALGGLVVTPSVKSVRLYDFSGAVGVVYLAAQIVTAIVILSLTIKTLLGVARLKTSYFKVGWNLVNIVYLLISYIAVAAYTFRTLKTMDVVEDVHNLKGEYINFDEVFLWGEIFNITFGLVTFTAILQFLRLLSFNRNMWLVGATMEDAGTMLRGFGFTFILMLVAFAILGVNLFSSETPTFKEFISALLNLSTMLLGKFDYLSMQLPDYSYAEMSARCFFLAYNVFVYWIMTSMAISLLSASVTSAREVILNRANEADVFDYLWNNVMEAFPLLHKKNIQSEISKKPEVKSGESTQHSPQGSFTSEMSLEQFIRMKKRPSNALPGRKESRREEPEGEDSSLFSQEDPSVTTGYQESQQPLDLNNGVTSSQEDPSISTGYQEAQQPLDVNNGITLSQEDPSISTGYQEAQQPLDVNNGITSSQEDPSISTGYQEAQQPLDVNNGITSSQEDPSINTGYQEVQLHVLPEVNNDIPSSPEDPSVSTNNQEAPQSPEINMCRPSSH